MAKTDTKTKKDIKQLKKDVLDDDGAVEVDATELPVDILDALKTKRVKKSKINEVDYVSEFERGDTANIDFDDSTDE